MKLAQPKFVPTERKAKVVSPWLLVILTLVSLFIWNDPLLGLILQPVKIFVTTLHELGHAVACLATGGSVNGLTIVSDNEGHGGLTMCEGGMPLIYTQAGYLGTAFMGCFFISICKTVKASRTMLVLVGVTIALASVCLMSGTIFSEGRVLEGLASMGWGLAIAAFLIFAGLRFKGSVAHTLMLFLAVQTALNSLTDVGYLIQVSSPFSGNLSFTDATNMQKLTHIPAIFWSLGWGAASVLMLSLTLWWNYRTPKKKEKLDLPLA